MIQQALQQFLAQSLTAIKTVAARSDRLEAAVLVVHRDARYLEVVEAAAARLPSGVHIAARHAASLEQGLAIARDRSSAIASVFLEVTPIADLPAAMRELADSSERLHQVVAIVPADGTTIRATGLQGEGGLPCLRESSSKGQLVDACRPLLGELQQMVQLLRSFEDSRSLVSQVREMPELQTRVGLLLSQLALFFGVDVLLSPDLKNPAADVVAMMPQGGRAVGTLRTAALRELVKRSSTQDAAHGLAALIEIEDIAAILDQERSTVRLTDYTTVETDADRILIAFSSAMHDSLVSGLTLAMPRGRVPHRLMLGELRALLECWAKQYESVTMSSLRARRDEDEQRERVSFQDSIAEMVCGISHEINTPLGIIRTASGLLGGVVDDLGGRQVDVAAISRDLTDTIQVIDGNIDRVARLIDNFKLLAVGQAPEAAVEAAVLDPIEAAIARIGAHDAALVVNRVIDLDPGAERWVGYPRRFEQVVFELLENASQHGYRGKGGVVEVRLRGRMLDDKNRFSLSISDFGAGIEASCVPRVFDAFFTTSRQTRATGLGLAIAKGIVSGALDGKIRCESTPGLQTTFTVDFASLEKVGR